MLKHNAVRSKGRKGKPAAKIPLHRHPRNESDGFAAIRTISEDLDFLSSHLEKLFVETRYDAGGTPLSSQVTRTPQPLKAFRNPPQRQTARTPEPQKTFVYPTQSQETDGSLPTMITVKPQPLRETPEDHQVEEISPRQATAIPRIMKKRAASQPRQSKRNPEHIEKASRPRTRQVEAQSYHQLVTDQIPNIPPKSRGTKRRGQSFGGQISGSHEVIQTKSINLKKAKEVYSKTPPLLASPDMLFRHIPTQQTSVIPSRLPQVKQLKAKKNPRVRVRAMPSESQLSRNDMSDSSMRHSSSFYYLK